MEVQEGRASIVFYGAGAPAELQLVGWSHRAGASSPGTGKAEEVGHGVTPDCSLLQLSLSD